MLVHGVFDSCDSFEAVIEHLVPEHTVLTYDRRGWARSVDATPATSLDDHADDLLAVMGERRATVVGHSYGGTVSFLAAVRAPERVVALGHVRAVDAVAAVVAVDGRHRGRGAVRAGALPRRPRGEAAPHPRGA